MYKRRSSSWLKHIDFIALDTLSMLLAFLLAYWIRFDTYISFHSIYWGFIGILLILNLAVCVMNNSMHNVLKRGYYKEFSATVKHAVFVFASMMILLVAFKLTEDYSRILMFSTFGFHIVFGYIIRLAYKRILHQHIVRDRQRSILVVADEADAVQIIDKIQKNMNELVIVAGAVLTNRDATGEEIAGVPVVSNLDGAARYICREWIDEVLLGSDLANKTEKLISQCREMGVVVHECLHLQHEGNYEQFVNKIAGYTVLTSAVHTATPLQALIKRTMDIVGGLVGCIIALIVIAVVGPKIKKESPGPILYAQERIGENGRRFKFYKIRSMYLDADARKAELMSQNRVADGMMFKLDFDPRIIGNQILPDGTKKTGIGAFIRNYSLDEFPQFFNVLKGDMSLVGTRPPTVDEWEKYELHHRARLAMRPGITGMWQVSGRSSITDFEEIVKLDTQYICNWSIGLDLRILFKTVKAVLHKDGAM